MTIASEKPYSKLKKVVWNLIRKNVSFTIVSLEYIFSSEGITFYPFKTYTIIKMSVGVMSVLPGKHSTLIQRCYMLKQRREVGQPDIQVDSISICQRWFIDKTQRWNNVDFGLTLKSNFVLI